MCALQKQYCQYHIYIPMELNQPRDTYYICVRYVGKYKEALKIKQTTILISTMFIFFCHYSVFIFVFECFDFLQKKLLLSFVMRVYQVNKIVSQLN